MEHNILSEKAPFVVAYTDGSCLGNPGPGGWACILRKNAEDCEELYGSIPHTTNNRMELEAVIQALHHLPATHRVHLYTDSQYVKNGMTQWIHNWKKNNWRTAAKTAVKNEDLWKNLDIEVQKHHVEWYWVKAHNGNKDNERVDFLARTAAASVIISVYEKGA